MPEPGLRATRRGPTTSRAIRVLAALVAATAALLCLSGLALADTQTPAAAAGSAAASGAGAADPATPGVPTPVTTGPAAGPPSALVRAGDDVTLRYGETVEAVFVLGGSADVAGTVRTSVVVIGGDAVIRSTAVIGTDLTQRDAAIVVVGGEVKESPGATVTGTTQVVSLTAPRIDLAGTLWHVIANPGISVAGWFRQVIFFCLVSLAVVALFPRPVRAVRDRAFAAPLASLGWGSLTAFMAGVVALILAATIIGLVIVVPAVMLSPFVGLFVYAATAFAVGDLLLARIWPKDRSRFLAAATGVIVISLVALIPVVGGLANLAVWLIGLGAAALALVDWRRARRPLRPTAAPVDGPPAEAAT